MANLSINAVRKVYPSGVQAIESMSVDVADGEFIVLVGPSGCGKSTLLRMIAGLESITDGTISIGDRVVNSLEPAERDIAMVFQNYALYPHMSVFDNMAYGLRNRRTPAAEVDKRVREAAKLLAIDELLDRRPRQLSGGQRQRVAMGRAIVRKPSVFLFDEPLSNLDAKLRVQMRVEIRRLQHRLGTTSVYVTHDQVEAMTMADRLVVMNNGVAEQIGTPREVYMKPATVFVAGFIGSPAMNFLPGRVGADRASLEFGRSAVAAKLPSGLSAGSAVAIGVRPEDLRLAADGEKGIEMAVELVEHLGTDTVVHGRLPGLEDELVALRIHGDREIEAGRALALVLSADRLHLFRADNGRRIDD
ncbi:MAG: sn-glycerol-3-phosphate import ATP-binding protein UgpC [Burkholderiaceae bacterium]|nr:sn-glycerol-3-phosphate import ATP-binding protein UgpC [Burkholderiaceae bacterium]